MSITERLNGKLTDAAEHLGLDDERLRLLARQPAEADADEVRFLAEQVLRYRREQPDADVSMLLAGEDVEFLEVEAFNAKFGLPVFRDGPPRVLTAEEAEYRFKFMLEEVEEFRDACAAGDLAKAYDALHDVVYVAKGTAHFMHCPWRPGWLEVQRANMAKEKGPSGKARALGGNVDEAFEVRKPAGWVGPDHERVLREHTYVYWRTDAG